LIAGCGNGDNFSVSAQFTRLNPACITCHTGIEDIRRRTEIACTDCHRGDHSQTQ